jgi:hypothetical protein
MTQAQGGIDEPQGEIAEEPARNQHSRWFYVRLISLGGSLFLHLAILTICFAFFQGVQHVRHILEENETIVPDATLVNDAAIGGVPNPGLGGDPNRPAASDIQPDSSTTTDFSAKSSIRMNQAIMTAATPGENSDPLIGTGALASAGGENGRGGNGAGGTGALPFGVPGGGSGEGPRSPFMGISGNAKRVVYVCDASGSMVNRMAALKNELRRSVEILQPIQAFNIIFFREDKTLAASHEGLLMASPGNKQKGYTFLTGVASTGSTDPIPALTLAFRQHPQLVYLLTDGDFPDNNAVIRAIRNMNREKKVHLSTIAFISSADAEAAKGFVAVLQQIAKENGGMFKLVSENDVN